MRFPKSLKDMDDPLTLERRYNNFSTIFLLGTWIVSDPSRNGVANLRNTVAKVSTNLWSELLLCLHKVHLKKLKYHNTLYDDGKLRRNGIRLH